MGLSDNGDFIRIMKPNYLVGKDAGTDSRFAFVETYYLEPEGSNQGEKAANAILKLRDPMSYPSLQHLFVKGAIAGNIVFNRIAKGDIFTFHIGALGMIFIIMHALSLTLLMDILRGKDLVRDIVIKAIAAVIFCDIGYIAYFNSFYGEAPQLVLFILSAALGLRLMKRGSAGWDAVLFCTALTAFAWTKFANMPAAALALIISAVPMFFLCKRKTEKRRTVVSLFVSFITIAAMWAMVPKWMDLHTNYNSVFFGILRSGKAPEAALAELGLPEYMKELADTTYYVSSVSKITSSESFARDFSTISKLDIGFYYLRHLELLGEKLKIAAKNSGFIRPPYLSNRDASYSRLTFDTSFSLWEGIRKKLPFNTLWFNALICTLFTFLTTAAAFSVWKKDGKKAEAAMGTALALSLLVGTLISFVLPVISNGEADLSKHMFAFVSSVDLMLLISMYLIINIIHSFTGWKKYGFAAAAAALILTMGIFLSGSPFSGSLKPFNNSSGKVKGVEMLSYIELGQYNGKKLLWQVMDDDWDSLLLICSSVIENRPFSRATESSRLGSNLWKNSDLRNWLNTEFINVFDPDEKKLISEYKNKYLLSLGNIYLKKGGNRDFYWIHIPELADRGYESAYYDICTDRVFLPDIRDISAACRKGADIRREQPYWLETPYFYDPSMVRAVFGDGYIYMKDASLESIGVVPAIRIKHGIFIGDGSFKNPYRLIR